MIFPATCKISSLCCTPIQEQRCGPYQCGETWTASFAILSGCLDFSRESTESSLQRFIPRNSAIQRSSWGRAREITVFPVSNGEQL
jgi:hypothetical protein